MTPTNTNEHALGNDQGDDSETTPLSTGSPLNGSETDTRKLRGDMGRRVLYLMLFRLIVISLVLGFTLLLGWLSDVDLSAPNSLVLFAIIGTTYLLTIVYTLAMQRGVHLGKLVDIQVAIDLATTTLLVHITGGAQSAYSFFFPLSIIGIATIRFRTGAIVVATASVVLFTSVSLLGWLAILPVPLGQKVIPTELSGLDLSQALALNIAAIAGVAALAVNLGSQIQHTSASLETERTAAADLYTLHEDIVRCLSSGLITVNEEGIVQTMNQSSCEILGTSPSYGIGFPVETLLPGLDKKLHTLALRQSLRRADLVFPGKDRQEKVIGVSVSPLRTNQDQAVGRIVNFQDLTEFRQMEQQMKQAERLAVVGTLAAGIAHEIRNPLASISGSVELLHETPEGEDSRALMEIITREIDRLNSLISDLLDYTNPQPRELAEFDLEDLVQETLRVFRQDRAFEHIEIKFHSNDSLSDSGLRLTSDPGKLRQVVWNLIRNAAEAAMEGQGHVKISTCRQGDKAQVSVRDDGPGIGEENLARVFDPFFTTKSRGSGLGLATCYSIVKELHGDITVENLPVQGCQFRVTLPISSFAPSPRVL